MLFEGLDGGLCHLQRTRQRLECRPNYLKGQGKMQKNGGRTSVVGRSGAEQTEDTRSGALSLYGFTMEFNCGLV